MKLDLGCPVVPSSFLSQVIITQGGYRNVTFMDNYFKGGRICKYCGINMDIADLDILEFIHGTCWQQYRKNGEIYPTPANE